MLKQQKTKLPYSTAILCFALLIGFLGSQSIGDASQQRALKQYLSSGLFSQETPLYLDYQSRQHRVEQSVEAASLALIYDHLLGQYARDYAWLVMQDRNFIHYLESQGSLLMQEQQFADWLKARHTFNKTYLSMTWPERFGLIPEDAAPATFVTHLFIDPYVTSLLLTMLLLCVAGPLIESRLGRTALTAWFLISGALYAVLYTLTSNTSSPILMGASGAASGLSGLAIAMIILGNQPLKTKAAISLIVAVLVSAKLWLEAWLKPLDIAQIIPHGANAILCAAIFILLFSSIRKAQRQAHRNSASLPAVRQGLNDVFTQLDRFNFSGAQVRIQRLKEEYPTNIRVAKHAYLIAKLEPHSPSFKADLDAYIVAIALHDDYYCAKTLLAELIKLNKYDPIDSDKIPSLIHFFASHNDLKKAEHSFKLYEKIEARGSLVNEAKAFLYQEFEKRNLHSKMAKYRV